MASQHEINLTPAPFIADKDLTAKQYYFVISTSTPNNVDIATGGSNPAPIGVLQNSPSAGQEAEIVFFGPTKVVGINNSASKLAVGKYIVCSSAGQAEISGSNAVANGRWISASVTSGSTFGEILLWPATACPQSAS